MGVEIETTYTNTCDRCGHKATGHAEYDDGIRYDPWTLEPHIVHDAEYTFDETDEQFYPVEFEFDGVRYANFLLCEKCYKEYQNAKNDKEKMKEFLGKKYLWYSGLLAEMLVEDGRCGQRPLRDDEAAE